MMLIMFESRGVYPDTYGTVVIKNCPLHHLVYFSITATDSCFIKQPYCL